MGSRNYKLCFWCYFVLLCLVFSDNIVAFSRPFIDGNDEITVRHGSHLELFCTAEKGYTSADLIFTFKGEELKNNTTVFNSTTIRLDIVPEAKARFPYYCKNINSNRVKTKDVIVGSAPTGVENFKCKSWYLEELHCSWTPRLYVSANYTLSFEVKGGIVEACNGNMSPGINECTISNRTQYRRLEQTLKAKVESKNHFGSFEDHYTVNHFANIIPRSPENFSVIIQQSNVAVLNWTIHRDLVHFLRNLTEIEHRLQYQANTGEPSLDEPVKVKILSTLPIRNHSHHLELSPFYPYVNYTFRIGIKIKEASDDFWSECAEAVNNTVSEKTRPPEIPAGAFSQAVYRDYREIRIYWKPLKNYEAAGPNFTYKVTQYPRSKSNPSEAQISDSHTAIRAANIGATTVTVFSSNDQGLSLNGSNLFIPSESETWLLKVKKFTKFIYGNGTYQLTWLENKNVDNYTIFWCVPESWETCKERLDFKVLRNDQCRYFIDLPVNKTYQFAIAANKGHISSGMIWSECDIHVSDIAKYKPKVNFKIDLVGKTFVKLSWALNCIMVEGFLKGYTISYYPTDTNQNIVQGEKKNSTMFELVTNPEQSHITIFNLSSYQTYRFKILANTKYNITDNDGDELLVTTNEDVPTNSFLVYITLVTIGASIIGRLSYLYYKRWDRKKLTPVFPKYIFVCPDIDTFRSESDGPKHIITEENCAAQALIKNEKLGLISTTENIISDTTEDSKDYIQVQPYDDVDQKSCKTLVTKSNGLIGYTTVQNAMRKHFGNLFHKEPQPNLKHKICDKNYTVPILLQSDDTKPNNILNTNAIIDIPDIKNYNVTCKTEEPKYVTVNGDHCKIPVLNKYGDLEHELNSENKLDNEIQDPKSYVQLQLLEKFVHKPVQSLSANLRSSSGYVSAENAMKNIILNRHKPYFKNENELILIKGDVTPPVKLTDRDSIITGDVSTRPMNNRLDITSDEPKNIIAENISAAPMFTKNDLNLGLRTTEDSIITNKSDNSKSYVHLDYLQEFEQKPPQTLSSNAQDYVSVQNVMENNFMKKKQEPLIKQRISSEKDAVQILNNINKTQLEKIPFSDNITNTMESTSIYPIKNDDSKADASLLKKKFAGDIKSKSYIHLHLPENCDQSSPSTNDTTIDYHDEFKAEIISVKDNAITGDIDNSKSYIRLQCVEKCDDSDHRPTSTSIQNTKGYISVQSAMQKHFRNKFSKGKQSKETVSPEVPKDTYCRFSFEPS